jgi:hypothetical protein
MHISTDKSLHIYLKQNREALLNLTDHVYLLDLKKLDNNKYECYICSFTTKSRFITIKKDYNIETMQITLPNGEFRYMSKIMYRLVLTKDQFNNFISKYNYYSERLEDSIQN